MDKIKLIIIVIFVTAADSEICYTLQVTYNLPGTLAACLQTYTKEQTPKQSEHLMLQVDMKAIFETFKEIIDDFSQIRFGYVKRLVYVSINLLDPQACESSAFKLISVF